MSGASPNGKMISLAYYALQCTKTANQGCNKAFDYPKSLNSPSINLKIVLGHARS